MTDQLDSETAGTDKLEGEKALQVEQIAASILVVDVRSSQGLAADSLQDQKEESSSMAGGQQVEQTQILTLALPPEQVQDVLRAVASAKKQGGLLWTTLAQP